MKEYFSREADRYMTSLVLRYNSEKNESEKLKLENIVVERTKVMLYLIPLRSCLIAEEELSGFLLDVMKDISRFITSFTISGTSYAAYLTQICRYRCIRYMSRKKKAERNEMAMLIDASSGCERPTYLNEKENAYEGTLIPEYKSMDFVSIIKAILEDSDGQCGKCSAIEKELGDRLADRLCRRRFIEFLLYLPQTESPSFIAGISRVLRIDGAVISHFYYLRHLYLNTDDDAIGRLNEVTCRYWNMIVSLQRSMEYETDEEKTTMLKAALERTKAIHKRKLNALKKARHGLSQSQIASLMDIKRSTVSIDLEMIRILLKSLLSRKAEAGNPQPPDHQFLPSSE